MWTFLRRSIPVALVVMLLWVPFVAASGQPASALGALWAAATPGFPAASASRLHRAAPQRVTGAVWSATADGAKAEVLVLLRDQADLAPFTHGAVQDRGRRVVQALQQTAATSQASLRAWLEAREVPYRVFYIVNALLVEADEGLLRALARRPEVAQIMANPQVAMALPPNEPVPQPLSMAWVDAIEWGVAKIGTPEVWALGYRGQGVVVAGQDTGYDWEHPALQRQYRGWNGAVASHDYNWHDAIHSGGGICGPDSPMPCDDNGHGTHTMGTIVGDDGADRQIGVAPEARWIGCRNMSQGVGTPATYAECFEFFLAPYPVGATSAEGDPDRAPDVINNSWSCPPYEGCDAENIAFLEAVVENVRA
ncbi:MAG: S8 family serine peptidase, partial [Anaerolineae bacterium]|nr:S8 family serine peptidase [Anaerolineae bacterium]